MMVSVTHAQQHRRDGALGVSFGGMNAAARSSAVGRVDANRASSAAAGSSSACRSSERASSSMRVFSMRRTSRGRVVLWSSTSSSAPAMAVCCWCVGSSLELLGGSKGSLCTHGPRSLRAPCTAPDPELAERRHPSAFANLRAARRDPSVRTSKMRLGLRSVRRLELASWRVVNAAFDASHKIFAAGMALATCAGPPH